MITVSDYQYKEEKEVIAFYPSVEVSCEDESDDDIKAFFIENTITINKKLWKAFIECLYEILITNRAYDDAKIFEEIEHLKFDLKQLKERSKN